MSYVLGSHTEYFADEHGVVARQTNGFNVRWGYILRWDEADVYGTAYARDAEIRLPDGSTVYGPDHPQHMERDRP